MERWQLDNYVICVEKCWPSDEEGERALKALRDSLPSKAQTRYNQRDIKKRNENRKRN